VYANLIRVQVRSSVRCPIDYRYEQYDAFSKFWPFDKSLRWKVLSCSVFVIGARRKIETAEDDSQ
jgi:hypothetical protein